jgi:hypothetical protein
VPRNWSAFCLAHPARDAASAAGAAAIRRLEHQVSFRVSATVCSLSAGVLSFDPYTTETAHTLDLPAGRLRFSWNLARSAPPRFWA